MSKVDNEHELNHNEGQSSDQTEIHPSGSESAVGNEESADDSTDDQKVFQTPETEN